METQHVRSPLADLYEKDETAWLEAMARLVAERRCDELDYEHLSEFLTDMAIRDKREVLSRLRTVLAHQLKWEHQPDKRSNSWRATITAQRNDLKDMLESRTLLNYAREVLGKAYHRAVHEAAQETGLPEESFPSECPLGLDAILGDA